MGKIKTFTSSHVTFDAQHERLKLRNFSHNPVLSSPIFASGICKIRKAIIKILNVKVTEGPNHVVIEQVLFVSIVLNFIIGIPTGSGRGLSIFIHN